MKETRNLLLILFIAAIVIGLFFQSMVYVLPVGIVALVMAIVQMIRDKRLLRQAVFYVRVESVSSKLSYLWIVVMFVVLAGMWYLIPEDSTISKTVAMLNNSVFLLTTISQLIANKHQDFINGIKMFDEGIQFPGRGEVIHKWFTVAAFSRNGRQCTLEVSGQTKHFIIHKQDEADLDAMIATWKNSLHSRKL